jgi:hypothetical protein
MNESEIPDPELRELESQLKGLTPRSPHIDLASLIARRADIVPSSMQQSSPAMLARSNRTGPIIASWMCGATVGAAVGAIAMFCVFQFGTQDPINKNAPTVREQDSVRGTQLAKDQPMESGRSVEMDVSVSEWSTGRFLMEELALETDSLQAGSHLRRSRRLVSTAINRPTSASSKSSRSVDDESKDSGNQDFTFETTSSLPATRSNLMRELFDIVPSKVN